MSSIDQQFVEFIVKSLVGNPDDVKIVRTIDEKGVLLQLEVAGDDLGRVIGKRGATAQSIRTLLRALGTKNDARYNLKIIDPDQPERPRREERTTDTRDTANQEASHTEQSGADEPPQEVGEPMATEHDATPEESAAVSSSHDAEEEAPVRKPEQSIADKHRADLADLDDLDI